MFTKKYNIGWLMSLVLYVNLAGCAAHQPAIPAGPSDDPTVASIDGQPLRQSQLLKVLLPGYGRRVLDELVLLELVRRHAAQQGLTAAPEDIEAEFDSVLEDMAPGLPRREQLALFNYMLDSRGLTRNEFDVIIEKRVLLRRLVDPEVIVSEKMLEDEHQRQHHRKVLVRQLVLSSFRSIQEAQRKLDEGADFAQLVEQFSQDQPTLAHDGLLGPFSPADEDVPAKIREEAFAIEQPGRRSGIFRYYDDDNLEWWCILQLEKSFPSDNVKLDDVRDELNQAIIRRVITQRMLDLQQDLKSKATIAILHPDLK
jgi:hypothetical protein